MVSPISPNDVAKHKLKSFPDDVMEVWNTIIADSATGTGTITVKQEDVVKALSPAARRRGMIRTDIFESGWLDIEPIYRAAGWEVEYDKPAYCENYPAVFRFTPKTTL